MAALPPSPRLDRLPPPTQAPLAAPPPPTGRTAPATTTPSRPPTTATALTVTVVGLVAIALGAAAGGAIWSPRDGDVDNRAAVVRGLLGAGVGAVVAVGAMLVLRRSGRLVRTPGATTLVIAGGVVLMALGTLFGAASAPLDTSSADPPRVTDRTYINDSARGKLVDADGDGVPDRDANGNPVIAFDARGDGVFEGRLVPCPRGDVAAAVALPLPALPDDELPLDFDCDGDIDAVVPIEPGTLDRFPPDVDAMPEQDLEMFDVEPGPADGFEFDGEVAPAPPAADVSDDEGGSSFDNVLVTLLVVVALVVLGLVIVRVVARRDRSGAPSAEAGPVPDDDGPGVDPAAVDAAIESSIEALLAHPDPRMAIRAAYAVLLDALAETGFARHPFEAPEEHLTRCLDGLDVEPAPMRTLLELFAIARFSTHDVTEDDRRAALEALRTSQEQLRRGHAVDVVAGRVNGAGAEPPR